GRGERGGGRGGAAPADARPGAMPAGIGGAAPAASAEAAAEAPPPGAAAGAAPRRRPHVFSVPSRMLKARKARAKRFFESGMAAYNAARWPEAGGAEPLADAREPSDVDLQA